MAQSMSDSQVLEYVKDGIRQGKEQKQLASELARKGVTKEQAMRVKQLYEQQNNVNTSKSTGTDINESRLREETKKNTSDMLEDHPTTQDLARGDQVFGRNIFNTRNLTFEPSVNLATPANYRLGPGDEVIIDIWGASQNTIRQQISPEGTINIQKIGPVNLSGMTVSAANDYLKNALNKIYNGLNNTTDPTSDIRLTLGNIRTIQINVMGEVVQPGTYALSSFSTVFHALYRAGGVSDIGSLRNVQLVRNGKNIATIDVYEFIMKGNTQDDIRLQEGDVVIVPAYDVLVNQCNMSAVDFMKLVSENPAKLYGMYPKKGTLAIGSDGDITIVDKSVEHVLSKESAHTKADYIPYEGISVTGKVRDVILRGHHVVQDGSLTESYLGECIP